jgi:hypothetical protein
MRVCLSDKKDLLFKHIESDSASATKGFGITFLHPYLIKAQITGNNLTAAFSSGPFMMRFSAEGTFIKIDNVDYLDYEI